jgi:hypothetical protein
MKTFALACTFVFLVFSAGMATARTVRCTVETVSGSTVTVDCGKKSKNLEIGSKVDVTVKKKAAIEGC